MAPLWSALPPPVLAEMLADKKTYWRVPEKLSARYDPYYIGVFRPSWHPVWYLQAEDGGSIVYVLDEEHRQALLDRLPAPLTAAQRRHVIEFLKSGMTQEAYCEQAGISDRSLRRWLQAMER